MASSPSPSTRSVISRSSGGVEVGEVDLGLVHALDPTGSPSSTALSGTTWSRQCSSPEDLVVVGAPDRCRWPHPSVRRVLIESPARSSRILASCGRAAAAVARARCSPGSPARRCATGGVLLYDEAPGTAGLHDGAASTMTSLMAAAPGGVLVVGRPRARSPGTTGRGTAGWRRAVGSRRSRWSPGCRYGRTSGPAGASRASSPCAGSRCCSPTSSASTRDGAGNVDLGLERPGDWSRRAGGASPGHEPRATLAAPGRPALPGTRGTRARAESGSAPVAPPSGAAGR